MALPSSGEITFDQVRSQLYRSGSLPLGDTEVRALANKTSGAIAMTDLHGKWAGVRIVSGATSSSSTQGTLFGTSVTKVEWNSTFGLLVQFAAPPAAGSSTLIRISNASFASLGTANCSAWDGSKNYGFYPWPTNPFSNGAIRWMKTA